MNLETLRASLPAAARDLSLNLQSTLEQGALSPGQRWLVALSCALATRDSVLRDAVKAGLASDPTVTNAGAIEEDAVAVASLMAMNNVYYRFRHMVGKQTYSDKPARLRMTRLARPATSKADFELASLAVSAINGCEMCVRSHEAAVLHNGLSEEHVHDAVRIAATVNGVATARASL